VYKMHKITLIFDVWDIDDTNVKKEMESTWSHSLSRHVPDVNKKLKTQKKKNNYHNNTNGNSINHDDFDETMR